MAKRPAPRLLIVAALTVLTAVLAWPIHAQADAVRIDGLWIENVQVRRIDGGQVIYLTQSGAEARRPVSELSGLRLDQVPEMTQAQAALEQQQWDVAAEQLTIVAEEARDPWLQNYARRQLVDVRAQRGEAVAAVEAYAQLVEAGVDPATLGAPPVEVVAAADASARGEVEQLVQPLLANAGEEARSRLEQLLAASRGEEIQGEGAGDAAAITLPLELTLTPIVTELEAGNFEEALRLADGGLNQPDRLAEKLYLQGMARLALAEVNGDQGRYKDAGLSFMRVAIHFPNSRLLGPSLLEAGYVHEKIGQPEMAQELYSQAANLIDEETEPAYFQRYQNILSGTVEPPQQP